MPSGPLAHICLLVEDLDRAIDDWTKILEVLDPAQLEHQLVRYEDFEGGEDQMRWATFVNPAGSEIQLMEPAPDSPLGRRLAKHGEGVHHICFTADDPDEVTRRLADKGVRVSGESNSDPSMPWQRWTWVLPASASGTLVEIARPYRAEAGGWVDAAS